MTNTTPNIVTNASEAKAVPTTVYVKKRTRNYVELYVQLAPGISRSDFTKWCDGGEVEFNAVELEDETYGSVTRNGESIGWYAVADWAYKHGPYRVLPTMKESPSDVPDGEPTASYDGPDPLDW